MGCRSGEAGGPEVAVNRKDITQSNLPAGRSAGNQRAANDPPTARALAGSVLNP